MYINPANVKEILTWCAGIASAVFILSKFNFKYNPLNILNRKNNELKNIMLELKNQMLNNNNDYIKRFDIVEKKLDEHTMEILELKIWSDNIPIEERLSSGNRYVSLGGNGSTKLKYKDLERTYSNGLGK